MLPTVFERLVIAIFVLAIAVPLVGTVTMAEPEDEEFEENREPAPLPARPQDWATLAAWPDAFTSYFADHFAFRTQLVRWQALLRVRVLRSSPSPDVILGKDGWLFYGTDGAVEDYSGTRPFTRSRAHRMARCLAAHPGLAAGAGRRLRVRHRAGQARRVSGVHARWRARGTDPLTCRSAAGRAPHALDRALRRPARAGDGSQGRRAPVPHHRYALERPRRLRRLSSGDRAAGRAWRPGRLIRRFRAPAGDETGAGPGAHARIEERAPGGGPAARASRAPPRSRGRTRQAQPRR